jgi:hypothetical protein
VPAPPAAKSAKKKKTPIPITPVTIGIAAAVVVLVAVGGWLMFGRGSDAAPPAQPEVAVVPPPTPEPPVPPPPETPPADPAVVPPVTPVPVAPQPATPTPTQPASQTAARSGQPPNTSARGNALARGAGDAGRGTAGQPPVTPGTTGAPPNAPPGTNAANANTSTAQPTTPTPPAVPDTPVTFDDLKFVTVTGQKSDEQDGILKFGGGAIAITARKGGATLATLAYPAIARATYVRSKNPQFDTALPAPPPDFDPPPGLFTLPTRHWLVLQTRSAYTIVHLDNSDVASVLDTIEKRTGVRVVRK